MLFQASYIGRLARHLLATRDVMALNDLRDPKSGMDWYTAATILEKQRQLGTDPANVQPIPYFENILPAGYAARSEEITSELQSRLHLVCRLLLEKKKKKT